VTARLAALVATAFVLGGAPPSGAATTPSDLEAELVCPTCETTLDQSDAPVARRMKQIIRERLAAGATEAEIKAELVDQFGDRVLAEPPKSGFDLLAWVVPLGLAGAGAIGVAALAWSWRRQRSAEPPLPLDSVVERRIDAELDRFDG